MMQSRGEAIDREAVGRALEEVFARAELRPPGEGWLDRQFRRLFDLLPFGELPEAAGWGLLWILAIVLGLMLGWVVVRLRRSFTARREPREPTTAAPRVGAPAGTADRLAQLRRHARAARERGDLVETLRLLFFALLVGLGRRGELDYRDAWTARELLERGSPGPEAAAALTPLVRRIDERTFGRRPVTPDDVDELEALCRRWLDGAEGAS